MGTEFSLFFTVHLISEQYFSIIHATRFERATFWSVARRSIQLSYACILCKRNTTFILYEKRRDLSSHGFRSLKYHADFLP